MKKLLFALAASVAALAYADFGDPIKPAAKADKEKPAADAKAGDAAKKTDAPKKQTTARKIAGRSAKSGFAEFDAGPWKTFDSKKDLLYGTLPLMPGDLFRQPVIVCVYNPAAKVKPEAREAEPEKFIRITEADSALRFVVVSTPKDGLPDDLATFKKEFSSTCGISPCYANFGLEKTPENKEGKYPFFYVVGIDAKVVYAGCNGPRALWAAKNDLSKHGEASEMLGYFKPEIHAAYAEQLKFGTSALKVMQKLKPIAMQKKPSDAQKEAKEFLLALEGTQGYALRRAAAKLRANPPEGVMMCREAAKTFPKVKEMFNSISARVENNPNAAKAIKLYCQLAAIKAKMQELSEKGVTMKKADVKKAYAVALQAEKACNKSRKENPNMPQAFISLENLTMEVKGELEGLGAGDKK